MFRTWSFRPNLVTGVFDVNFVLLQVRQRFSQRSHIRQMERHVVECRWGRSPFKEGDSDVVVSDRNAVLEVEFFAQPKCTLEPSGALLRVTHR